MNAAAERADGPELVEADKWKGLDVAVRILRGAAAAKASDVHLKVDRVPSVRIEGELCPLEHPPVSEEVVWAAVRGLAAWGRVDDDRLDRNQCDFSCVVPDAGRFRVHVYRERGNVACAIRRINETPPEFAELRLPPVLKRISLLRRGLVMVCGATGNGKSTTIAAMLHYIGQRAAKHVVTIEDPVEFIAQDNVASFAQREVGRDVSGYEEGLVGALREDPDVIFIGEIRTFAQFDLAMNAAESGRLVISTLHATDAGRAVSRMINWYPPEQKESACNRLADALSAVICQRLVPKRGSRERILVTEVLTRTPTVQDCIRDPARLKGLNTALERGKSEYGTHTFDQELLQLVRDKIVDTDVAKGVANSPNDLIRALNLATRS